MTFISDLFSLKGRLDRKAFWINWLVLLIVSIALAALWIWIEGRTDLQTATLAILPLRVPMVAQQVSMHVRRLRDAGRSWLHVFFLLVIYALMGLVALYWAIGAIPERAECQLTEFDGCGDAGASEGLAFLAGLGPLTGFPGPLSLLWSIFVGRGKSRGNENRAVSVSGRHKPPRNT